MSHVVERRVDVRVVRLRQALAGGPARRDRGQALLRVAAVPPEMLRTRSSTTARSSSSRIPAALKWLARDLDLSSVQAWNTADELALVDQPILESQQPEQEVARGSVQV